MIRIRIQPRGVELTGSGGERLLDLVDEQAIASVPLSCRGARCGICRLRVVRGAGCFAPAERAERETLALLSASTDERLGCQLQLARGGRGEAELSLLSEPPADG